MWRSKARGLWRKIQRERRREGEEKGEYGKTVMEKGMGRMGEVSAGCMESGHHRKEKVSSAGLEERRP